MSYEKELAVAMKQITMDVSRCRKAKRLFLDARALASSPDPGATHVAAAGYLREGLIAEVERLRAHVDAFMDTIEAEPSADVCATIQMALSEGRED